MKKLVTIFIAIALCACLFMGCGSPQVSRSPIYNEDSSSMFITVEHVNKKWRVVYHEDTKVMYVVSCGDSNRGTFTVMLNPDGTPMIWEGN